VRGRELRDEDRRLADDRIDEKLRIHGKRSGARVMMERR
jgi:hypothetical protein